MILFDGCCPLCLRSVRFVLRHDRAGRFRFATLDSSAAPRLLSEVPDQVEAVRQVVSGDTVAVVEGERLWLRSDAALRIAVLLGWPWKVLSILKVVPRRLRNGLYSLIARRRHSLAGRLEDCPLPDPETAERFL